MNRIKYLIIASIILVFLGALAKGVAQSVVQNKTQQAQVLEPVSRDLDTPVNDEISKDILIDDHEKPIVKTPEPKKVAVKKYITAESYVVGNLKTGEVYIELNPDKVAPIASVSKLYTALVVRHLFDQKKEITITQSMLDSYGESGGLMINEKFVPGELLYSLLLVSSNDAAEAFAQSFGFDNFMYEMNGFAKEIGMHNTFFADPSGLSPQNVSSANDLFALTKYLYTSEKSILDISKTPVMDLATTTQHGYHHYVNINPFAKYPYFSGGKTGRTNEAKEAMVSIFDQNIGGVTYPVAIIILRSDLGEREMNTEKLLGLFMDKLSKAL